MAINRAILLTIGDDGVVESFRKGPVSNYVDRLGKLIWVNCCLKISVRDFDKVVGWRRDHRWVYGLSIPTPIHIVVAHIHQPELDRSGYRKHLPLFLVSHPLYDPKSRVCLWSTR